MPPPGKTLCEVFAAEDRRKMKDSQDQFELPLDQTSWLPLASAILAGDYNHSPLSTLQSLYLGLHRINHPTAQKALTHLRTLGATPRTSRKSLP